MENTHTKCTSAEFPSEKAPASYPRTVENLLPVSAHEMMPSLLLRLLVFTAYLDIFVYLAKSGHVW